MHPNAELITRFYSALQRLDGDAMAACYHDEAEFSDPVFPALHGLQIGMMWRMLCRRAKDFSVTFGDVVADDTRGSAKLVARYRYSKTGRMVVNEIHSEFEFRDGLIWRQRDAFNLHRWMGMALGPVGTLLFWLPALQAKVRASAAEALAKFTTSAEGGR